MDCRNRFADFSGYRYDFPEYFSAWESLINAANRTGVVSNDCYLYK